MNYKDWPPWEFGAKQGSRPQTPFLIDLNIRLLLLADEGVTRLDEVLALFAIDHTPDGTLSVMEEFSTEPCL